jgi:predicted HAD superfamily phosphohydrolase
MENKDKKTAKVKGKVLHFPFDTDLRVIESRYDDVKIPRDKHWYNDDKGNQIHLVKWNQDGVSANSFVEAMKKRYIDISDDKMKELFEKIRVVGNDKFSIIENIPNVEIFEKIIKDGKETVEKKTLVSKITSDLIKLLK